MKIGIRKPNIEKSVKSRTTGKIKRNLKKTVNPLYQTKGMGYVNNPQKAIYNKLYNKTTFSLMPTKKDGLFIMFVKFILWMYYLLFKYVIYIPIKYLINKIKSN